MPPTRRVTLRDLQGILGPLPLSTGDLLSLLRRWGEPWDQMWSDVLTLGSQFAAHATGHSTDETHRAWHHLVLAAGNFKRPGGTSIRLKLDASRPGGAFARPSSFVIPGTPLLLDCEDPSTWPNLGRAMPGLGSTPTATTLLSALWPGRHVIVDVRDLRASVGLLCDSRWASDHKLDAAELPQSPPWSFYVEWLRPLLIDDCPQDAHPVDVERALFLLDELTHAALVQQHGKGRWLWSHYLPEARHQLEGLP